MQVQECFLLSLEQELMTSNDKRITFSNDGHLGFHDVSKTAENRENQPKITKNNKTALK